MEASAPSENNYSLPIGLRYNLGIADSVPAVRNVTQYLSSNATTFSGAGTNVCRIPVSSGNFLDFRNLSKNLRFCAFGACHLSEKRSHLTRIWRVPLNRETVRSFKVANRSLLHFSDPPLYR